MNKLVELKQIFKKEPSILNMLNEIEKYIIKLNNIIQGERDIRLKAIEILGNWTIFETSAYTDKIITEALNTLKGVDKE